MHPTRFVRISALALLLFLVSVSAFAVPPCGCGFCQRFPDKSCRNDGTVVTCLEFLAVALCPAGAPATSAKAPSSEEFLFPALTEPTQDPAVCLSPTN